jgi:hypothetical protein
MDTLDEIFEERLMEAKIEQELRADYDFALEHFGYSEITGSCVENLENLCKQLREYGWITTPKELIEAIL